MLTVYTADVMMMPPGEPAVKGADATPRKGGKPMTETIKGIHIYKRQSDGTWKIAQDVWNTDPPPPVAK